MNTTRRTIATGIAAVIAGVVSLGAGFHANAASRPSPDINKRPSPAIVHHPSPDLNKRPSPAILHRPAPDVTRRPKPTVATMPCPAADNLPQCDLHSQAVSSTTDTSVTALRRPDATGGGAVVLNVARLTPSPQ